MQRSRAAIAAGDLDAHVGNESPAITRRGRGLQLLAAQIGPRLGP